MTKKNLENLRHKLHQKHLNGFLVPRADAWPGEFVSKHSERLKWLSGFSGSAGIGVVLIDKAIVLTDGRYTLQVKAQVDPKDWISGDITKVSVPEWLLEHSEKSKNIGFDPFLHSVHEIEKWKKELEKKDIILAPITPNPIDDLWIDQPTMPQDPVTIFPEKFAGESSKDKIKRVTDVLKKEKVEQFFFTMPDSIAWLLNVRGNDVEYTPVPLSYGLLRQDGTFEWFIDPSKVSEDVKNHIGKNVKIRSLNELERVLSGLNSSTGLDERRAAFYFSEILGIRKNLDDPCIHMKACKNKTEQDAIRNAHIHDGQALLEFHRWLKDHQGDNLDEIKVEKKLEEFRRKNGKFFSPSFDTISGFADNGAIIHYRASKQTNKKISGKGLLLIDSGAQYLAEDCAGTTDVTRTYIIGKAENEDRFYYTIVLKAHIAVAKARFPYGTNGTQIDAMARSILWQEGLDFAHGLGHGVGCFLNVHEEASHLSPRGKEKLEAGMLLSNEPGLYIEGQFGIRIENLLLVQKTGETDILGREILCFETVTLAPYDNDLIDFNLLNGDEMGWLKNYYQKIEDNLKI